MARTLEDSLNLFNSKINQNYWMNPDSNKILRFKNYSDILLCRYNYVDSNSGKNDRFNYDILADYYHNVENNITIAQTTASRRMVPPSTSSRLVSRIDSYSQISISTYVDASGEVVTLNRFDYKGHPHGNDYSIFSGDELYLYEKYFTDYEMSGRPMARNPHMHFETQEQSMYLPKSNAISLENILKYLTDLLNNTDPRLQAFDLGMPFLNYYKNKISYANSFFNYLLKFIRDNETNEITQFMKDLINRGRTSTDGEIDNISTRPTGYGGDFDMFISSLDTPARISRETVEKETSSLIARFIDNPQIKEISPNEIESGKLSIIKIRRDIAIYLTIMKNFSHYNKLMVHLGKVLINSFTFNQALGYEMDKEVSYNV